MIAAVEGREIEADADVLALVEDAGGFVEDGEPLVEIVRSMPYRSYKQSGPTLSVWTAAGRGVRRVGAAKRLAAVFCERANASRQPDAKVVPATWSAIGAALRNTDGDAYTWASMTARAVAAGADVDAALRTWSLLIASSPPPTYVLVAWRFGTDKDSEPARFRWWPRSRVVDRASTGRKSLPIHENAAGEPYAIEHHWDGISKRQPLWNQLGRLVFEASTDLATRALRALELAVLAHVPNPAPFVQPEQRIAVWNDLANDLAVLLPTALDEIAAEIWQELRTLPGIEDVAEAMGGSFGEGIVLGRLLAAELRRDVAPVEVRHLGRHLRAVN